LSNKQRRETATLGGGCFWCTEAVFDELKGVVEVESGYSGGTVENPSYEQVCTGRTGHAEVVQVKFDPEVISYEDLLRVFFTVHDPTTLNRQGNDAGTQYRSVISITMKARRNRPEDQERNCRRENLRRPDSDGGFTVHRLLQGRRLPSGVFREQSQPGILPDCDSSEGGEVPRPLQS